MKKTTHKRLGEDVLFIQVPVTWAEDEPIRLSESYRGFHIALDAMVNRKGFDLALKQERETRKVDGNRKRIRSVEVKAATYICLKDAKDLHNALGAMIKQLERKAFQETLDSLSDGAEEAIEEGSFCLA